MKKKIWKITSVVALVVLLAAVSAIGTFFLIRNKNVKETGNIFGISWYNETDTEFTITTQEELYEFACLSDFYSFKNQTVKLGADIVVNEGNASDWAKDRAKLRWTPISGFAGTFDGQGHSISGIYGKSNGSKMALFIDADYSCTVKNVKLINSYFETSGGRGVASFVSNGGGKFYQLYSDAIISHTGEFCGGIASRITDQSTFEECWFDGTIELTEGNAGGIVDMISVARVTMKHCLFSGNINQKFDFTAAKTGGICGRVMDGATVVLSDSLACGSIVSGIDNAVGSLFGRTDSGVTFTITDSYVSNKTYDILVGTKGGSYTGTALAINADDLEGVKAYQWTTLDFDKYWAVTEDSTPILKCFAESAPSLEGVAKGYDVSWYTKGSYNFEIKTKEQLYGFMYLSASNSFTDTIVKLGADIVVNEGKAVNWEKKAPELSWYGIQDFTGTFDGQGHTISGLYVNASDKYAGLFASVLTNGAVRNVNVKNSYFCSTFENGASVIGSIVGDLRGNMRDIYSDAIVVSYGDQAGGLAGRVNDSDTDGMEDAIEISNCWFDGELYMKTSDVMQGGGIVGNLVQGDLNISHCLNTGTISSETVDKGVHLGGIIGSVRGKGIFNLSDSLNAGDIVVERDTCVGSVIGRAWDATATVNLTNTYATSESFSRGIGDNSKSKINGGVIQLPEIMLTGYNAYKYTELDFPNYWAIVKTDTPILQSFASSDPSTAGLKKMVNTSWYKADAKTLIIDSVEDLYGFAILSRSTDFAGQTVKLGADLTVNVADAATLSAWANGSVTAENLWAPIGTQDKVFAGTFDGQGHTISGLYLKTGMEFAGLFGVTSPTSMVKNFSIKDSYFCYTSENAQEKEEKIALGSVCGDLRGDMENVYSNAIVHSIGSRVGGLVGITNGAKLDGKLTTSSIKNCWFDGEVKLTGPYARYAGGIAGIAMQGTIELFHCLNTGSISNERETAAQFLGGIIGSDQNPSKVYITDCLNTGSVTAKNYNGVAAIFGMAYKEDSVYTLKNVCATDESCVYPNGKTKTYVLYKGSADGYVTSMPEEWYYGTESYEWSTLDFENYFAARTGNVPALKTFVNEGLSYSGTRADISWYDEDAVKHHIENEADFFGFTVLVHSGFGFEEESVYLDADLKLNKENQWFPIGDNTNLFRGTFDGQKHTIQGVYINSDWKYTGLFGVVSPVGKLKNFSLRDSYIAYTSEESLNKEVKYALGSICGDLRGDMENIYSNAFVTSTASRVGGLVGSANGAKYDGKYTTSTIQNCWFDGEVKLTGPYARYAGGIAGIAMQKDIEILHCLNTGTISNEREDAAQFIGGIIGSENNPSTVYIKDTMNAGTVTSKDTDYNGVSSIIGMTYQADSVYTLENVYATDESCVTPKGVVNSYMVYKGTVKGSVASMSEEYYLGTECYKWSLLDYKNYWAARKDDTPSLKYFENQNLKYDGVVADTDWYNAKDEKLYIRNVEEFYGLTALVRSGVDFKNQTVYLDVKNDALKLDKTVEWLPIGTESNPFCGTFDGQDATISGVSINANGTDIGLFGVTAEGSSIQNFSLKDSKITYSSDESLAAEVKAGIGTVCGTLGGNLINVYSSADIDSTASYVGGLVGVADGSVTIEGCWYDGDVKLTGDYARYAGGILGVANGGTVDIAQSLNTGTVSNERTGGAQFLGGIIGSDVSVSQVDITDCIAAGKVSASNYNGVASIVGMAYKEGSTYTFDNVYTTDNSCSKTTSAATSYVAYIKDKVQYPELKGTDTITFMKEKYYLGTEGYRWTTLNFEENWATIDGEVPAPKTFVDSEPSYDGIIRADVTWYDEEKPLYIDDEGDLYGLTRLVDHGNNFEGKTITLTDDLIMNSIDADTVQSWKDGEVPKNPWIAIGNNGTKFRGNFTGLYEGEIHSIRGIYVNGSTQYNGLFGYVGPDSQIDNLILNDSYIYNSGNRTAAIAGSLEGTIKNVYVGKNVIVEGAQAVGGLVGFAGNSAAVETIENCWFAGDIYASSTFAGGIVGWIYNAEKIISNCLFTGNVYSTCKSASSTGGVLGHISGAKGVITIQDCVSNGMIKVAHAERAGSVLGAVDHSSVRVTIANTYTNENRVGDTGVDFTTDAAKAGATNGCGSGCTTKAASFVGIPAIVTSSELEGNGTYIYTALDLWTEDNKTASWVATADGPELKTFSTKTPVTTFTGQKISVEWYTNTWTKATGAKTYKIANAADFYGFERVVNTYKVNFSGDTVQLDEDINLNSEWVPKVDEETGALTDASGLNEWTAIGSKDFYFQGTFTGLDGEEIHSVSGIYINANIRNQGLFGYVGEYGQVNNLILENSYVYNSADRTAAIAGTSKGILKNVYVKSSVTVKGEGTVSGSIGAAVGGIVGFSENTTQTELVSNSWFAGDVYSTNRFAGGIVGWIYNSGKTVSNCLFTGSVYSTYEDASSTGGIVGHISGKNAAITIKNCVSNGLIDVSHGERAGSVLGGIDQTSKKNTVDVKVENVYTNDNRTGATFVTTGAVNGFGSGSTTNAETFEGVPAIVTSDELKNDGAYIHTQLVFRGSSEDTTGTAPWVARADGPELAIFSTKTPVTPLTGQRVSVEWYTNNWTKATGAKTYTISDAASLYGFERLVNTLGIAFKGDTIKLGANIDLNPDWTPTVDDSGNLTNASGLNEWTPIGVNGGNQFNGVFDGQGTNGVIHSISGVYVKYGTTARDAGLFGMTNTSAQIKNMKMEKSYISCAKYTSAVAGAFRGPLMDKVSVTNTVILRGVKETGGLIGLRSNNIQSTISNSCFAGTIYASDYGAGGILGTSYGGTNTISNCLFAGKIFSSFNGDAKVGGLVGQLNNRNNNIVNFIDCLSIGEIEVSSTTNTNTVSGMLPSGRYSFADGNVYTTNEITHSTNTSATFTVPSGCTLIQEIELKANSKTEAPGLYDDGNTSWTYVAGELPKLSWTVQNTEKQ